MDSSRWHQIAYFDVYLYMYRATGTGTGIVPPGQRGNVPVPGVRVRAPPDAYNVTLTARRS